MHQRSGRLTLLALFLALISTTAAADAGGQNDAGTGADAGNTRAMATPVSIGASYLNNKLRVDDVDWYAADVPAPGLACIRARGTAGGPTYFALGVESPGVTRSAPFYVDAGRESTGGVAGLTPMTATLRVAQARADGATKYNFSLERVSIPQPGGDAGSYSDAGETPSTAIPVSPGCLGGNLEGLDIKDTYALAVGEGEAVTYTLASASNTLRLTLVDAVGNALGPSIAPGEIASVSFAAPSTVYLTSAQTSSVSSTNYAVGSIVGPDPAGCRPMCMD